MLHAITLLAALTSTGQNSFPSTTYNTRISADRNGFYVDSVWTDSANQTCYYQHGGDTSASMVWSGSSPDIATDDNGNVAIVYYTYNSMTGTYSLNLIVNGTTYPITTSRSQIGNPYVTVARTSGAIAMTWLSGGGNNTAALTVYAAICNVNGSVGQPFPVATQPVNNGQTSYQPTVSYYAGGISSDVTGNFIITYVSYPSNGIPGIKAVGYSVNGGILFGETLLYGLSQAYGYQQYYSHTTVSCWSNGSTSAGAAVVTFNNQGSSQIWAVVVDWSGNILSTTQLPIGNVTIAARGQTGCYVNNMSVACMRGTPGSYILTYSTCAQPGGNGGSPGSSNVVYMNVVGTSATSPIFVTNAVLQGQTGENNNTPAVAVFDSGHFVIDWTYVSINGTYVSNQQASY